MIGLIALSLLVVVVTLWLSWRWRKLTYFKELGIPGPEPSLFFGNLLQMYNKDPIQCHKEWIQTYGRVVGFYYGLEPVLLVADLEVMKQVLVKNFNSFIDRPARLLSLQSEQNQPGTNLLSQKGQRWKEVRSLITPSFTTGKLKAMTQLFNSALEILLKKMESKSKTGEAFDIYNLYKGLTMDAIGRAAFGIESNVQDNPQHPLMRTARLIFSTRFKSMLFILGNSFREFRHFFIYAFMLKSMMSNRGVNPITELFQTCREVMDMRKKDSSLKRHDLLQAMIEAQSTDGDISNKQLEATVDAEGTEPSNDASIPTKKGSGKTPLTLPDTEIISNALVFFLAGYETTSTALAFLTHVLVNKQDVQDNLRKEINEQISSQEEVDYNSIHKLTYMDRVINECLRFYPPIYGFATRYATEDTQLGKWKCPKGTTVLIPIHFLHHDPELWSEPETFDADRFLPENRTEDHNMKWIPFGVGPRNCVGMRFALVEIKLALTLMLRKYRFEPCEKTEKEHSLELGISTSTLSPVNGVFVRVVPLT